VAAALGGPWAVTPLAATGFLRPLASLFYVSAVVAASFLGGVVAGLMAVLVSAPLLDYYVLPPTRQLSLSSPTNVAALVAFAVVALVVGELLARFERARSEARASEQRFSFLVQASSILGASLDYERTLNDLARLAVSRLADWCAVDLLRDDGVIANAAVARAADARRALATLPRDPNVRRGVRYVVRSGRSELYPRVPEALLVEGDPHPAPHRGRLASVIIAPLSARGRTFGALTLVTARPGRAYTEEDRRLAEDLADRAALAIENARLHRLEARAREEADRVSRTLQRGLLPPELPDVPGIDLAAIYLPVGEGVEVGGDFYDVFEGASGEWAVLIGDVCGKGPEAAALTGLVRHSVRAVALFERCPSQVLAQVNRLLLDQAGEEGFSTMCYAAVRPERDGVRLRLAVAGHPLPYVVGPEGVLTVGSPGQPLGILPRPLLADDARVLRPGELLVLYTDGLVDPRAWGQAAVAEKLVGWLEACAGLSPAEVIGRLEGHLAGIEPRDDIALVVLRAREPAPG
jgi:serine phosphatase RsbU (regulator of sigma subunit)